jgi:CubicO group peptidase (beta-lactamase class C family)
VSVALPCLLGLLFQPQLVVPEATFDKVAEMVQSAVAEEGVGAVSYGVVVGGELVHSGAFGYVDMERKILATPEHVYRIGSITKQFTALALEKLAQSGKLRLTDPVDRYVPEVSAIRDRPEGVPVPTLLQLATMTSGLAREPDDLSRFLVGPPPFWKDVVLEALPSLKYDFAPDTRYQYSNIGYAILGVALERASGRDYMDYVREEILEPLGMRDTDFVPRAHFEDRLAAGYDVTEGGVDHETPAWEHLGRGYKVPNGALYSSVPDLARFLAFELGFGPDRVLPREALEAHFSRLSSAESDLSAGYGVGFSVVRRGELVIFGHGGSVAGYRAGAYFDRERGIGVVLLRNVTGGALDPTELAYRILEITVEGSRARDP